MRRRIVAATAVAAALFAQGILTAPAAHADETAITVSNKPYTRMEAWREVTVSPKATTLRITFPAELPNGLVDATWEWSSYDSDLHVDGVVPDGQRTVDIPVPAEVSHLKVDDFAELRIEEAGKDGSSAAASTVDHEASFEIDAVLKGTTGPAVVPVDIKSIGGGDEPDLDGLYYDYETSAEDEPADVAAGSPLHIVAWPGFFTHGPNGTWKGTAVPSISHSYTDCSYSGGYVFCLTDSETVKASTVSSDGSTLTFLAPSYKEGRTAESYYIGISEPYSYTSPSRQAGMTINVRSKDLPDITRTTAPQITGTPQVGKVLSVDTGAWSPTPTSYSYQWYRAGKAIPGATKSAYTLVAEDLGQKLTAKVTAAHADYDNASFTTSATAAVIAGAAPKTSTAPSISGTAQVGKTLTAGHGTWSPAPTSYGYQWYRSGTAITGATKSTYILTASDKDKKMTVKVTARKTGYTSGTATTAATAAVKAGAAPKATTAPSISGTKKVGSTLTANHGTWTPAPTSYAYQWYRNGKAITGATKSTYKLTTSDRGRDITVKVTAKKTGYTSGTATTKAVRIS